MYAEWPPDPALADRIACVWRQVSEDDRPQLVVPDGCVDLIWGPSGPFVAGPDTGPAPTSMRRGDVFTGIRFEPGAAGEVFGVPLSELRDQRVPAEALDALPPFDDTSPAMPAGAYGDAGAAMWAGASGDASAPTAMSVPRDRPMAAVASDDVVDLIPVLHAAVVDRLPVLHAAVVDRLRRTAPPDPAAPAVAAALRRGRSVREVAWDLGLSERQLHRRSVASFGYAPKTLQRIVRFQRALRLARSGVPLADVAAMAGYADQAHLSHDVRRLSGATLRRLVA